MNYAQYIENSREDTGTRFLKLADAKDKKREKSDASSPKRLLKELALVGAGTGLGAGLGYGTTALIRSRYEDALDAMSPASKIRLATPTLAGVGGLLAIAQVLRQRADARNSRKAGE